MEQQAWLRINRKILKSAVTSNLSPHYSQGGSSFAALGTNRLMFTGHHPFYEESSADVHSSASKGFNVLLQVY